MPIILSACFVKGMPTDAPTFPPQNPLERLMRPYRRRLYLPLLLALAVVVLFIWQSALLAALFAGSAQCGLSRAKTAFRRPAD